MRYHVCTTPASSTVSMDVVPCTESAVQENDFEFIPAVKIESGRPVEGPFGRELSSICNVAE